jgi:hypothetical protein
LIRRKALLKLSARLCLAFSLSVPAFAQAPPCALLPPSDQPVACLPPLTRSERLRYYLRSTVGPEALLSRAATAGIAQARNSPSAWEQGMAGYGRRFAHRTGKHIVDSTIRLGVESALGLDSRYYLSPHRNFSSRVGHVFRTTLLARTRQGNETLSVGRIAGAFGGGLISRQWQPEGHRSIRQGFESGALSFGYDFASHAFEEFFPALLKRLPF